MNWEQHSSTPQIPYAASKAGVVGMTIVAARDLAARGIRVNTIAPGVFDTSMLARLPETVREGLGAAVPFPSRLGRADEFAALAHHGPNQFFSRSMPRACTRQPARAPSSERAAATSLKT